MKLYTTLDVVNLVRDATSDMRANVERLTAENEALRRRPKLPCGCEVVRLCEEHAIEVMRNAAIMASRLVLQ